MWLFLGSTGRLCAHDPLPSCMQHCFGRTRDSSERGFNMPVQRRHFSQLLVLILDWLVLI